MQSTCFMVVLIRSFLFLQVKRKYRIPNSTALSSHKKRHLGTLSDKKRVQNDEVSVQRQSEVDDAELAKVTIVNIHEAAAVAAQAVAEAEAAMVEADEAAKQAEIAEAEAEAAQVFAEEVSKSLKGIKQLQCGKNTQHMKSLTKKIPFVMDVLNFWFSR